MNVKKIVEQYLKVNGYGGLYGNGDCACVADDLMFCGEGFSDCEPGYCCPCDCGEHDFHIRPEIYHGKEKQV